MISLEEISKVIRAHQTTAGMQVSMGWTCQCGHWCSGKKGENYSDHQAAEIMNAIMSHEHKGAQHE